MTPELQTCSTLKSKKYFGHYVPDYRRTNAGGFAPILFVCTSGVLFPYIQIRKVGREVHGFLWRFQNVFHSVHNY